MRAPWSIGGKMNVHVLICDDDSSFTKEMETWLFDYHFSNFDGSITIQARSNPELFSDLELSWADIALLDIDMTPINGIEMARRLRQLQSAAIIIFVTNYIEYSPDGYEVNAFRYVLKHQWKEKLPRYYAEAIAALSEREQNLKFKWGSEQYQVKLSDILFLESRGRMICLHLLGQNGPEKNFYSAMNEMQDQLGSAGFLRIHKSFLINMAHVKSLCYKGVTLDDGTSLPISQRNYAAIHATYINWKLNR